MNGGEAVELLRDGRQGIAEWNRRRSVGEPIPPMHFADLRFADLRYMDLRLINLQGAVLSGADLRACRLNGTNLCGADLRKADMRCVISNGITKTDHFEDYIDPSEDLGADFAGADLRGADLSRARLRGNNFEGADLRETILRWTDLRGAILHMASLEGTDLRQARLLGMELDPTFYGGAMIDWTTLPEQVIRFLSSRISSIRALSMGIHTRLNRAIPADGSPSARVVYPMIEGVDPMWDPELDSTY